MAVAVMTVDGDVAACAATLDGTAVRYGDGADELQPLKHKHNAPNSTTRPASNPTRKLSGKRGLLSKAPAGRIWMDSDYVYNSGMLGTPDWFAAE
jgi:hypothetical protein